MASSSNGEGISSGISTKESDEFYNYFGKVEKHHLPIVYSDKYNISFMGLEKLHPFDSCKYMNIVKCLKETKVAKEKEMIHPKNMPTKEHLTLVHTEEYLKSLFSSYNVAVITEVPICAIMPNFLVRSRVLNPMLYATSGSILAAKVALERGFCINLSGGYHHACGYQGGGFCVYSDITLSLRHLRRNYPQIKKVMIIDLDAHQGNGHERDKLEANDVDLFIMDMYNAYIYPGDMRAKAAIDVNIELRSGTEDGVYINRLKDGLQESFSKFEPQIIYYNAGTDILEYDPLGCLGITPAGVVQRDEIVFEAARQRNIPLVMLLSGGYQKTNARVIAHSITNILGKFLPQEANATTQ